jgi:hypothetical protein
MRAFNKSKVMKRYLWIPLGLSVLQVLGAFLVPSRLNGIPPALSNTYSYVDEGPSDIGYEVRNGILVKVDMQGKAVQRMGTPQYVSPSIVRVGATYYCQWEGFAEQQVKQYNYPRVRRWWCTPRGIEEHPRGWNY